MTSAPRSASSIVAYGPASTLLKSATRTPSRAPIAPSDRVRGQLATRSVDLASAGVADRRGDLLRPQPVDELLLDGRVARRPLRTGGRVERDRVDVDPAGAALVEQLRQPVGAPGLVVDVPDQRVLDAHPAAGRVEVAARAVERLGDRPSCVDRH